MISLLLPTRQRKASLIRFYRSAMDMAEHPRQVEVVVYIDDDDHTYDAVELPRLKKVRGERIVLSQMWNECWKAARGEYYGHMGDDIVFRSPNWDTKIKEAIDTRPGKICFAWGNDFQPDSQRNVFGTHGFVHKNWTDIVGRFVPPYFSSDYNDSWFNDVGEALHVRTYCHDVWTEHMHYSLGKAEIDQNTRDRLERHIQDDVETLYKSPELVAEREKERELLHEFITKHR